MHILKNILIIKNYLNKKINNINIILNLKDNVIINIFN